MPNDPKTGKPLPYPPNPLEPQQPQAMPPAPAGGVTLEQAFNNTGPEIAQIQSDGPVQQAIAAAVRMNANKSIGIHKDLSGNVIDKTQFAPSREIVRTRTVDPAKIAISNDRTRPMEERMEAFNSRILSKAGGGVNPEDIGFFGQQTTGPDQIRARTMAGIDTGAIKGAPPLTGKSRILNQISTGAEGEEQLAAYLESQGMPRAEQDSSQARSPSAVQIASDKAFLEGLPPGAGVINAGDGGTPERYEEPVIPANAKPPREQDGGVFSPNNVAGDIIHSPFGKPRTLKEEEQERRSTYPDPYKGKQMTNQQKMQLDMFYRTGKDKPLALQNKEERKASRKKESESRPSLWDFFVQDDKHLLQGGNFRP